MRFMSLSILLTCVGCRSFEGEYTLTTFDQGEGVGDTSFEGESGTMSISKESSGTLDVELPLADGQDGTWTLACSFELPETEQTNFRPDCEVDITTADGLLDAGTYPVKADAYMNTTGDGDNTNFYFSPDDETMWPMLGFYRFSEN